MEDSNSGMSRAAKKRAKKKKRQLCFSGDQPSDDAVPATTKKSKKQDTSSTASLPSSVQGLLEKSRGPNVKFQTLREIVLCDEDQESQNGNAAELTSSQRAHCALQHMLRKVTTEHFYKNHWEKMPLLIQCGDETERNRFDGFLSEDLMRQITKVKSLRNGVDFNVTRYQEEPSTGKFSRATLKVDNPEQVWEEFAKGATVRWLRPQQFVPSIHSLLSLLELEWGCMVGANAYLTPAGKAQGFAPHYDDIEALLLQLEGQKRWKVYAPLDKASTLPRVSSEDFDNTQLADHRPVLDITLEAGDVLYMPRGWIHQAVTTAEDPSLHLTISTMQQWSWADLVEMVMPEAMEAAIRSSESTSLREGLPVRFLDYMGVVHDNSNIPDMLKRRDTEQFDEELLVRERMKDQRRETFRSEANKRIMDVANEAMNILDAACDQMGNRFLSERLPPALSPSEKLKAGESIGPNTLCRLARPGIARLVLEDEKAVVYHCADNSLVYQEVPISPVEYEMDHAPALEQLVTTVAPHWIEVADLHHDSIEDKIAVTQSLYEEGIIQLRSEN